MSLRICLCPIDHLLELRFQLIQGSYGQLPSCIDLVAFDAHSINEMVLDVVDQRDFVIAFGDDLQRMPVVLSG